MNQVLNGVRVVEHGTFITGPAASMILADMGAEVVKVELPGSGDPFRAFRGGLYSTHFQTYNRNKRSVTLNPKLPEDAAVFDELVKDADVYIQNFRPGAADRLGAGEAKLRGLNPRLVYCAISGFGQTGPRGSKPGLNHRIPTILGQKIVPDMTEGTVGRSQIVWIAVINHAVVCRIRNGDLGKTLVVRVAQKVALLFSSATRNALEN